MPQRPLASRGRRRASSRRCRSPPEAASETCPWDSARARLAVCGMMPETFSLLLCVHAGSPWPSLIFIRRHAGREVAFPKAQPLRAHLDPTTIGMPLQAHLEPPDRRIVGVHVADLAVVFGLRVCMHSLHGQLACTDGCNPLTRTRQPTSQCLTGTSQCLTPSASFRLTWIPCASFPASLCE